MKGTDFWGRIDQIIGKLLKYFSCFTFKSPYWGFSSRLYNNDHGDVEEGEEENGEEKEDKEGDLVDWIPLKYKEDVKMFMGIAEA